MRRTAFSLIELSIVLVILGLLVGGILAGQSLIRASELRSVANDLNRYKTAIYTFRDKYFALPGDMTNATSVWGAVSGTGSTCRTTASNGTLTCDGNGDGYIYTTDSGTTYSETFHAWVQMADAGLIEGSYTGKTGTGSGKNAIPGTNVPISRIGGAGYFIGFEGTWVTTNAQNKNVIMFGNATTNETYVGGITPTEAWNIDTKIDDGVGLTGKLGGMNSSAPWCLNSTTYVITEPTKACGLIFVF